MSNRWVLGFVLLAVAAGSNARAELANAAAIDAYLGQRVALTKIPGLVAMVVDEDGELYRAAAGRQNVAGNVSMADDAIFRVASMTKPIAAAAIMLLVEEGKLGLDDGIAKYIPEFAEPRVLERFDRDTGAYETRPARGEMTIRQMLSHSSGLAYGFSSHAIARISADDPAAGPRDLPLLYDPGTGWSYAGGIGQIATVLERIEGMGLDTFLRDRIFTPLGMRETWYIVPAAEHARVVTIQQLEEGRLVEAPNPADIRSQVSGDGGLHTTAADYAKFIRMILNGGVAPDGTRVLGDESIREMSRNQLGAVRVSLQDEAIPAVSKAFPLGAGRDGFGLGFQVTGEHDAPDLPAPGSLSWAGIFNTQFWIDPANGIGGILLMQYLPFYDEDAIATLIGFEQRVYEGLGAGRVLPLEP